MNIKQVKKDFDDGVLLGKETLRQLIDHTLLIETCAAKQVDEWNAVHNGHKALVRELDVLLNGEEGAAKQASLCDIVAQVRGMVAQPVAYVHKMHFENGNGCDETYTAEDAHPWGIRGEHYSRSLDVTTQALIAVGPITKV